MHQTVGYVVADPLERADSLSGLRPPVGAVMGREPLCDLMVASFGCADRAKCRPASVLLVYRYRLSKAVSAVVSEPSMVGEAFNPS
jgi:hypothetical protein